MSLLQRKVMVVLWNVPKIVFNIVFAAADGSGGMKKITMIK